MKVLVIDDSRTMRKMIIKQLNQLGINDTAEAGDGHEALAELIKLHKMNMKADLILTDWNMPTMSGLEFAQTIRQRDFLKNVPIIMITTNNTKNDVVAAIGAGVNNYITKPFEAATLKEKIIQTLKQVHGIG